ncbi:uncharacterized protein TEOVI_000567200 [Trypanosoma equiperdum]|uniref:Uncharacterized protein n=2 Tax=Trypanozoon TaxID=39700 RepID=Q38DN5_TRYB2|nr:hypothetical protein, unlikely [Trypanosoma brucei brucei TREU927]EAN77085.1 hypothetical protein, unlikely [Trypanosoma brucei brucei TREU927]SCU64507.1 hypothetical protein, conserved [Trypanosoma equiperdum]
MQSLVSMNLVHIFESIPHRIYCWAWLGTLVQECFHVYVCVHSSTFQGSVSAARYLESAKFRHFVDRRARVFLHIFFVLPLSHGRFSLPCVVCTLCAFYCLCLC